MTKLLRGLVGVAIGVASLWLALRDQDVHEVLAVRARSDASWLLLWTTICATSVVMRVARWSCLLAVVVEARARAVGEVLLVGSAINKILPARLGELVRADYGKRRLGSTRSALLATIVIERVADLARSVAALLCATTLLEPLLHDAGKPWRSIKCPGRRMSVGCCAHRCGRLTAHGAFLSVAAEVRAPPSRRPGRGPTELGRGKQDPLRHTDARGLEPRSGRAGCILRASGIVFGLLELLLVLGLANLSTLLPTAPAYLGSYQFSYAVAFAALGWSAAHGIAVATSAQVFLLAPVTVLGILTLILRSTPGWARSRKAVAPSAPAAPRPRRPSRRSLTLYPNIRWRVITVPPGRGTHHSVSAELSIRLCGVRKR